MDNPSISTLKPKKVYTKPNFFCFFIRFLDMQLSDFNFNLPDELIARYPLETRSASRLLHLDRQGQYHDQHFTDILDLLEPGDLLV